MTQKTKIILAIGALALVTLLIWVLWANTDPELTECTVACPALPDAFDGFRIAQVSDLHNSEFGEDNETLLAVLRSAQPDIIAITGDLIDSRRTDVATALAFVENALEIAPCYYVTGNHEARLKEEYASFKAELLNLGVVVLENDSVLLERDGQTVTLLGVQDPSFGTDYSPDWDATTMERNLAAFPQEGFRILLSHRPEFMELYSRYEMDLVLTGHAHGGQVRLPLLGGLYAPGQGIFPEYDAGLFEKGDTQMIVSRGIGNSIVPLRFNNRPEVILITLRVDP